MSFLLFSKQKSNKKTTFSGVLTSKTCFMKTKSLNSLSLNSKMISNLSSSSLVGGASGPNSGCSMNESCDPTTDASGGASCKCQ